MLRGSALRLDPNIRKIYKSLTVIKCAKLIFLDKDTVVKIKDRQLQHFYTVFIMLLMLHVQASFIKGVVSIKKH
jgi:hypothetical protein